MAPAHQRAPFRRIKAKLLSDVPLHCPSLALRGLLLVAGIGMKAGIMVSVLLGFHQMLLELFFGLATAARGLTQFLRGLGPAWIQISLPRLGTCFEGRGSSLDSAPGTFPVIVWTLLFVHRDSSYWPTNPVGGFLQWTTDPPYKQVTFRRWRQILTWWASELAQTPVPGSPDLAL